MAVSCSYHKFVLRNTNKRNITHDSRRQLRDLNPRYSESETEVTPTQPQLPVIENFHMVHRWVINKWLADINVFVLTNPN